jgi:hypothetical protein
VLALGGCDASGSPRVAPRQSPAVADALPGASSVEPSAPVPTPYVSPTPILIEGRAAVAEDYQWFSSVTDLADGFCFTWVRNLTPPQVIKQAGGKELERISWDQLVGSGDGQQAGSDRYFFGVAHVGDDWSLLVEDNGDFGTTLSRVGPLSRNTTVISNFQGRDGTARLLVLRNGTIRLDFNPQTPETMTGQDATWLRSLADISGFRSAARLKTNPAKYRAYCTAASFALVERLVGIAMTRQLLDVETYLLTSVPLAATPPA